MSKKTVKDPFEDVDVSENMFYPDIPQEGDIPEGGGPEDFPGDGDEALSGKRRGTGVTKNPGEAELTEDSVDPLARFLNEVREYANITPEEEALLIEKVREGDQEALDRLILSKQKLLVHYARKFMNRGLELEDLVAAGNEGLMAAVKKYDPEKSNGATLATYASSDIMKSLRRAVFAAELIRKPESVHLEMKKISDAESEYREKYGKYPGPKKLSEITGIKESKVIKLLMLRVQQPVISLDATVGDDDDTELYEIVAGGEEKDNDDAIEEILKRHIKVLDDRERRVFEAYYGLFGTEKKNLGDLAKELGLSVQRVSQIKKHAEKVLVENGMLDEIRDIW